MNNIDYLNEHVDKKDPEQMIENNMMKMIIELQEQVKIQSQEIYELKRQIQNLNNNHKKKQHAIKNLTDLNYTIIKKSNRKVFCLNENNMIYAGGVLLYKIVNDQIYFLMIYSNWRKCYEDVGGKVDKNDDTVYDTVIREAREETNDVIKLTKEILTSSQYFYNTDGKYILFLVEANDEQKATIKEDFGPKELHDNIERTIEWINCDDFIQKKIKVCQRVDMLDIINHLKKIELKIL